MIFKIDAEQFNATTSDDILDALCADDSVGSTTAQKSERQYVEQLKQMHENG